MPPAWNDDHPDDRELIGTNSQTALRAAIDHSLARREPSLALAREWHRIIYEGCRVPVDYYAGEFRDSDPDSPHLREYEIRVGSHPGVSCASVPGELDAFERAIREVVSRLDSAIPSGERPGSTDELNGVLTQAAYAHGEWVRIHPFANGNGRTARIWANWCLVRYGLAPFVTIKPRPIATAYSAAASESMQGNHRPTMHLFLRMLADRMRE